MVPCWFIRWHWTNKTGDYHPHPNVVIGDLAYDRDRGNLVRLGLRRVEKPLRAALQEMGHSYVDLRPSLRSIRRTIGYVCQEKHTTDFARWAHWQPRRRNLVRLGTLAPRMKSTWERLQEPVLALG